MKWRDKNDERTSRARAGIVSNEMEVLPAATVREWLERVRTTLDELVPSLRAQFPDVKLTIFTQPVGSRTEFHGHDVGLEATFPSYDCVALVVCAAYLATTPRVAADVSWNAEASGGCEASTWDDVHSSTQWPYATADNLAHIDRDLPRLFDAFRNAIGRYLTALH